MKQDIKKIVLSFLAAVLVSCALMALYFVYTNNTVTLKSLIAFFMGVNYPKYAILFSVFAGCVVAMITFTKLDDKDTREKFYSSYGE